MKFSRLFIFALGSWALLFIVPCCFADASIGEMSGTLHAGTNILAKLMWAVCIILGTFLLTAAITQYQVHRTNPKLVPLTTPITYLILAVVAIAVPFADQITGFLDSYVFSQGGTTARVGGTNEPRDDIHDSYSPRDDEYSLSNIDS